MNATLPKSLLRYTLAEIAEALGVSKQATAARAVRESWAFDEETGRGGKKHFFHLANLPTEVRQSLQKRAMANALPIITQHAAPVVLAAPAYLVTDKQRLERDARSGVLAALHRLQEVSHCSQEAALTTLLTNASAGRLDDHLNRMLLLARDSRGRKTDHVA